MDRCESSCFCIGDEDDIGLVTFCNNTKHEISPRSHSSSIELTTGADLHPSCLARGRARVRGGHPLSRRSISIKSLVSNSGHRRITFSGRL
jgi:hypothetical protein